MSMLRLPTPSPLNIEPISIPVRIDPRELRSFQQLDLALQQLYKYAIDAACCLEEPARITLSFSIGEVRS